MSALARGCALAFALASCGDTGTASLSSSTASTATPTPTVSAAQSATTVASASDPAAAIPLTKRFSAVGDRETRRKEKHLVLKLDITAGGTATQEDTTEDSTVEKITEVVSVDGELVTKVKVEYRQSVSNRKTARGTAEEKSPLSGKTYWVELLDSKVVITGADGKPPKPAELAELTDDHKNFGKGPRLLKALPESVKVGDSLDEFAKAFSEAAAGGPEGKGDIKRATAIVKGAREEAGVRIVTIAIEMAMEGKLPSGLEGKVTMSGTIELRADRCWPVASKVTGPVEFTFGGKGLTGTAKGTLSESTAATYAP